MPKNAKGRNKRSQAQNTPRVRPLEALLRRGDNRAYQEACSIITLEEPMLHPPGSVFPHGRWDPNGEWTEENFRITQETIKAIINQMGAITQEDAQAILDTAIKWERDQVVHTLSPRKTEIPAPPPDESPATPAAPRVRDPAQQLPEVEQHRAGIENLNARLRAARSLLAIPQMDPWLQAESVGLQIGHALEALEDIWRRMHRRAADSTRGTGDLPEFTRRTSAITSGNTPRDAETVQVYLDEAASWLTNGVEGLLDHTTPLSSGQRLWAHMTGPGGEAACGMLPGHAGRRHDLHVARVSHAGPAKVQSQPGRLAGMHPAGQQPHPDEGQVLHGEACPDVPVAPRVGCGGRRAAEGNPGGLSRRH